MERRPDLIAERHLPLKRIYVGSSAVTSARAGGGRHGRLPRRPLVIRDQRGGLRGGGDTGTLTVTNLRHAETDPKAPVAVTAGCEPVRVPAVP
jgi:hypothetical protein